MKSKRIKISNTKRPWGTLEFHKEILGIGIQYKRWNRKLIVVLPFTALTFNIPHN